MFGKILGKKEETQEDKSTRLKERISKMNLSDMRIYVNNKLTDFEICEEGLNEVIKRLISIDENERRFIETDAMDSKIKKAFDLMIMISTNKRITIDSIELIQKFIKQYDDLITKFDKENKQIYASKLKTSLENAIATVVIVAEASRKDRVLGN